MSLPINEFLSAPGIVLDVRSPGEYAQGRIPGAHNMPLFSDEERVAVGTVYKQVGQAEAIELGLKIVGPKIAHIFKETQRITGGLPAKIHCWRGGMRSSSVAQFLQSLGLKTLTLKGGYKSFRSWALKALEVRRLLCIVGGYTGSGKTAILHILKERGEQVLDLEGIAHHRGSSFGMIGQPPQPSNEQFENEVAVQWAAFDSSRPIWIEDESRMIGLCRIPNTLFDQITAAPMLKVERPKSERFRMLVDDYAHMDKDLLIAATERLRKKLGGARTQKIISCIDPWDPAGLEVLMEYYDAAYEYSLQQRAQKAVSVSASSLSIAEWADTLIKAKPPIF